jgi:hypothetical protein
VSKAVGIPAALTGSTFTKVDMPISIGFHHGSTVFQTNEASGAAGGAPSKSSARRTATTKTRQVALLFASACFFVLAILTGEPAFILIGVFPALASLSQC